jgi:hypothetical protein
MLGLILDNIIVFVYRLIATSIGNYRSRAWPTTVALVEDAYSPQHESYPFAEVAYSFVVENQSHTGVHRKGFWYTDSAKRFAARFPPGRKIIIRYHPGLPTQSFLREEDQMTAFKAELGLDDSSVIS